MPELKTQLRLEEINLPVSKAKCKIGLTYGDQLKLQNAILGGMKFKLGQDVQQDQEIDGEYLAKDGENKILAGLKDWDMEIDGKKAEINWENISMLDPVDGDFLKEAIAKLSAKPTPAEVKKK